MNVQVRPMTASEFDAWLPIARTGYAEDMIANGGVGPEQAHAKAAVDFATLLPVGLDSEGQWLYAIEEDGDPAGDLWIAEREADVGRTLFVYDVHVHESRRGRGLGRQAMLFVEDEARRRGIPRVALNVFGGNEVARGLYRSLGYYEAAIWMAKDV